MNAEPTLFPSRQPAAPAATVTTHRQLESHDVDLGASRTLRISVALEPDGSVGFVQLQPGWYRGNSYCGDHTHVVIPADRLAEVAALLNRTAGQ